MKPNPAYSRIRLPEAPDLASAAMETAVADTRMHPGLDLAAPAVSTAVVSPASWSGVWGSAARSQRLRGLLELSSYVLPFVAVAGIYEALRGAIRHADVIHVADLLALEHRFFSISTTDGPRALSDLIAGNTHPLLDLWCGMTYLLWVPQVFAMTAWLYVRARPKALELAFGFLFVNLAGWAIWLLYPAAPPWYVDMYGTGAVVIDAPASTAGLARLDALLGVPITETIYSKSAYVFGAMPSLHVAYSTLVAGVVFPLAGRVRWVTLAVALSMAFSAVYLRHHYLLDVVAGVALALPVIGLMAALVPRVARALGQPVFVAEPRSPGGAT